MEPKTKFYESSAEPPNLPFIPGTFIPGTFIFGAFIFGTFILAFDLDFKIPRPIDLKTGSNNRRFQVTGMPGSMETSGKGWGVCLMRQIRGIIILFGAFVVKHSGDFLLAAMLLAATSLPFRDPFLGEHEYHSPLVLFGLTLVLYAVARKNQDFAMSWLLVVIIVTRTVITLWMLAYFGPDRQDDEQVILIRACMAVGFLGAIILLLTNHLWASRIGVEDSIKIAGALYMMIGIEFANIHSMVYIIDNTSFYISPGLMTSSRSEGFHAHHFSLFIYYSFSSLTMMGLGDISPITRLARTLTWIEGVIGQMFMVVLMAKVINLRMTHETPPRLGRDK